MPLTSLNLETPAKAPAPEKRNNPLENPSVPLSAGASWLFSAFGAVDTVAGVPINEQSAIESLTAVYSCVNTIASDLASLPLRVYAQGDKGKKPATDNDLYALLVVEPNDEMTASDFLSTVTTAAVLTGSGYAEIERDATGKAIALWPRHPSTTKPIRLPSGTLAFESRDTGTRRVIANADMLHIKGITLDGYGAGISPIAAARQTLGLCKAAENSTARFFGNGSRPSGILTVPQEMDDQQRINARESWERANSGDNSGRSVVLPSGFAWQQLSLSAEDSQFIATMQFSRSQIAGIFRVPPHMIGDTSRLSNSNHESIALEYVTWTLRPWLTRWEREVQRKLMPSVGRNANKFIVQFDYSELVRGDFATQMQGISVGRQWGALTANEARATLGMNPVGPEGDVLMTPVNMENASALLHPKEPMQSTVEDGPPPPQDALQRTLVPRMSSQYGPLFRDALGRLQAREKRDADAINRCLTPVLQTVAHDATQQALSSFRLPAGEPLPTDKIIRDALKTAEKRIDDPSDDLITRLVRAVTIGVYKEAATVLVAPQEQAA